MHDASGPQEFERCSPAVEHHVHDIERPRMRPAPDLGPPIVLGTTVSGDLRSRSDATGMAG
jgi:hypothetical protein